MSFVETPRHYVTPVGIHCWPSQKHDGIVIAVAKFSGDDVIARYSDARFTSFKTKSRLTQTNAQIHKHTNTVIVLSLSLSLTHTHTHTHTHTCANTDVYE